MPIRFITIIGAGGHALVAIDALLCGGWDLSDIAVCDQNPDRVGQLIEGIRIAPVDMASLQGAPFHVAIGRNDIRRRLHTEMIGNGGTAISIMHPAAIISRSASLAPGCLIAAQAVVAPHASLGSAVIVNHGGVVDHECVVGDFSHVAPAATMGGASSIGGGVLLGAGARLLPGIAVGQDAVVGAGAVVADNLDAGGVYVGIPARRAR
jgi:sugar O-acyltransferase (sialic acid O-acetyltransferase NeuD family)